MTSRRKHLVSVIVSLALLDFTGIGMLFAFPDLTDRVMSALALIQLVGFILIIVVSMKRDGNESSYSETVGKDSTGYKKWLVVLFGGIATLYLLRALLEFLNMSVYGWRRSYGAASIAWIALSIFFFVLAFLTRRAVMNKR